MKFSSESPALAFQLESESGLARASTITLPHGDVTTPVFMPVGTYGAIKGLAPHELDSSDALQPKIILANTYHLGCRPGAELLQEAGGLHKFMRWNHNILTDSGGFQMVSLLKLLTMNEEGVEFQNPDDGSKMMLTPELSMKIQNSIGADIMMALDDVVSSTNDDLDRMKDSSERTIRWLDRCIAAHIRPTEQNLYGIVQGGLDPGLREYSLKECIARNLPGYAIGGLSGGEGKDKFWRVVAQCCAGLPKNKPRYLMGVGYPLDIVCCVALGVDQFDCVYPTRTARFGTALVPGGQLRLTLSKFSEDDRPIQADCVCSTCKNYSRSYINCLAGKEPTGAKLITVHNIAFMLALGRKMRAAILEKQFTAFVRAFMTDLFPPESGVRPPTWVRECLETGAGITISDLYPNWESRSEASDNPRSL
jgi:queuine tRNA-ribosyltransferase catalytic subunit